jgi:hypothetical protein
MKTWRTLLAPGELVLRDFQGILGIIFISGQGMNLFFEVLED